MERDHIDESPVWNWEIERGVVLRSERSNLADLTEPRWRVSRSEDETDGEDKEILNYKAVCSANVWVVSNASEGCDEVIFVKDDIIIRIRDPEVVETREDPCKGTLVVDGRAIGFYRDI